MIIKLPPKKKYIFGGRQGEDGAPPDAKHAPQAAKPPRKIKSDAPPDVPFLRFDTIVGRGGMAVVWRAWHKILERNVAVKVLDDDFAAHGDDVRQFMMEVRAMTDLHHPGIVQGYGADCAGGRYYFIMDYVDGYTFGSLLHRKSRIPEEDARIICASVADAMCYAWNTYRVIHCDIKPENIMVDSDGTVKITDLGLCRTTSAMKKNGAEADEVVGTPAYISPEQVYGDEDIDCRADIYSLGASLYHLVAGRMLFPALSNDDTLRAHVSAESRAPDARTFAPSLSEGFARMLAKMLVKDKELRYKTWEEVMADSALLDEGGLPEPPPPEAVSSMLLS